MKFAVIGGDRRALWLCRLLSQDGHRVYSYALERLELPEAVPKAGCLEVCVYGADAVLLPVPAERGGLLNAPYAVLPCPMEELIGALWPGQTVFGGGFSEASRQAMVHAGLSPVDLLKREPFLLQNAAITAEGALAILLQERERTLLHSRAVVCGWGRIGKLLALRLKALGAEVTVGARQGAHRAEAEALGLAALPYDELGASLADCDVLVNTVPARVLDAPLLCCLREGALLLELASAPGGFDRLAAEQQGLRVLAAPGLPGRSAPAEAALAIRRAVYRVLEKREDG